MTENTALTDALLGILDRVEKKAIDAIEIMEDKLTGVLGPQETPQETPAPTKASHVHSPAPWYVPQLGDEVSVMNDNRKLVTGFVSKVNDQHRSVKVAVGTMDHVTEFLVRSWDQLSLIKSSSVVGKLDPRVQKMLDDSLDTSVQDPAPEPDAKAYEDLKAYYEERVAKAEELTQKVSARHQDFKRAVTAALGIKMGDVTERRIVDFIRHEASRWGLVQGVTDQLKGAIADRESMQ